MSEGSLSVICQQHRRYQGRGTKRTIFLLVETRRANRQSSRPSVVTGMSSIKSNRVFLTELYTEVFTIAGEYYCLDHIDHKQRLTNQWKEKYDYRIKQNNGKENLFKTHISRVYPSEGQVEHDIHVRI